MQMSFTMSTKTSRRKPLNLLLINKKIIIKIGHNPDIDIYLQTKAHQQKDKNTQMQQTGLCKTLSSISGQRIVVIIQCAHYLVTKSCLFSAFHSHFSPSLSLPVQCTLTRRINAQRPGTPRFRQNKQWKFKNDGEASLRCLMALLSLTQTEMGYTLQTWEVKASNS